MIYDVVIVGAGVIGAMTARNLMRYKLKVCMLEKGNDVSVGASKANSGIIHGGFDPVPGTLKAKMNTLGVPLLYAAARELNVPHENNGSMVLAFGAEEEKTLYELKERGEKNGIKDLRIISGDEARKIEKNISPEATAVLLCESSGIICPYQLTIAAAGNAMDNGAELKLNFNVSAIKKEDGVFTLTSDNGEKAFAHYVVNAAGAHSDEIADMAGDGFFKIIPRTGEYLLLDKTEGGKVTHTIFNVPTKEGKGILVSPTADHNLLLGPTAYVTDSPDDVKTTKDGLSTVGRLAKKSVPDVNLRSVITSFAGVRASEKDGDFIIKASDKTKGLVHAAAIDSPGLSSCAAIAELVTDILKSVGLKLDLNPDFNPERKNTHAFGRMTTEEKDEYIKMHPEFGRIICRCEGISEGEIKEALMLNPKPCDLDGIKRRVRAGMGRCQGGFCSPYVMRIISEQKSIPMEKITKKGEGSELLTGEAK